MAVENAAKELYKAGEKKIGTDERTFIGIFPERISAHLAAVSSAYRNMYGNSLEKVYISAFRKICHNCMFLVIFSSMLHPLHAIKKETSGLFKFGLSTILGCAQNPAMHFAKVPFCNISMLTYASYLEPDKWCDFVFPLSF